MKTYEGWRYNSTIFGLDSAWRWVVSFMSLPLYPQRRGFQCPLNVMQDEPQGLDTVKEKNLALLGIIPWPSSS
jgi:hypothetical protein